MRFILLIFGWIHLSIEFNFYIHTNIQQSKRIEQMEMIRWYGLQIHPLLKINSIHFLFLVIFVLALFSCIMIGKKERGNLWIRHMHWTCRSICVKYTIHNHPYLLVCIQPFETLAKLCNKLKKHFLFAQQFYTVRLERFHSCFPKYRKKYIHHSHE